MQPRYGGRGHDGHHILLFHPDKPSEIQLKAGEGLPRLLHPGTPKKKISLDRIEWYIDKADIAGQGTVGLKFLAKERFRIVLNSSKNQSFGETNVMVLDIGENVTHFRKRNNDNQSDSLASTDEQEALLDKEVERLYWFSLDKKNRRLRYGKGPMQSLLTVFSYDLPPISSEGIDEYAWIENLRYIAVCGIYPSDFTGEEPRVELKLWRLPVTVDLPPFIAKREDATLAGLEMGKLTVIDNLPEKCQVLYGNVAGSNVTLNTPDFPDFSDAIEHSINTPGLICYEKLKDKASEFGKPDPKKTYLRVTLGVDQGNSPGVPFVLEIWPSGHYSPIHSHSNSFAIIKVLYNEILARYYAGLHPEDQKWYNEVPFQQGQITWISDELYQTHQLYNRTRKMCATIQCYQYGDKDNDHYEYFDYIDDSVTPNAKEPYKPDTDWPFNEFKNLIRKEWEEYKYLPDEN